MPNEWNLSRVLLWMSSVDAFLLRDAVEGIQVFGATGSGKSSAAASHLAVAYLLAGFGGLVLTAKSDEVEAWIRYCEWTGRSRSLWIVDAGGGHGFNFLDYELRRPGRGGGHTQNLTSLLRTVMEASDRHQGAPLADPFWAKAADQLVRNCIDLASLGKGSVTLPLLLEIVTSGPRSIEELQDESWRRESTCFRLLEQAERRNLSNQQRSDLKLTAAYWLREFAALSDKTRSSIITSFTALVDHLLRGSLGTFLCGQTTFVPEVTHEGGILVVNLPVLEYREIGVIAQVLLKTVWQRATEARNVQSNPRPVFLWADESHLFVTEHDAMFQTTARSSRAATVYLTQSIANYHAVMGGRHPAASTSTLLGNLQTKVFHQNSCAETNRYAEGLFGTDDRLRFSGNASAQGAHFGWHEVVEPTTPSRLFGMLRKGGPENDCKVDAIVFQGGKRWLATGRNKLMVRFQQPRLPRQKGDGL